MLLKIIKFIALLISFMIITGITAFFTIHFLIKNQPVVIIPDVRGKEINQIVKQLESISLTPRIKKSEFSVSIPVNHIIEQEPKAGETVKKGRDVHLVLSKGKKSDTMPTIINLSLEDARIEILRNGLKLGHFSFVHHKSIPKNHIISSSPQEGIPVKTGTKVNILISLGKRPSEYLMPDVTGKTIEDATKELSFRKLEIASIKTDYTNRYPEGIILSQSPAYGVRVYENDNVALVLNQKSKPSIVSPVIGSRIISYVLPSGILKSHIKSEVEIYDRTFVIHDNYFAPRKRIDIFIPLDQNAEVKIFKDGDLIINESLAPFQKIKKNKLKIDLNNY